MKRLVVAMVAAVVLTVGSAVGAFAQEAADVQADWNCPGLATGANGDYDYSNSPTIKRLAGALKMDAQALGSELKNGKTVAEVAKARGVLEQTLVDLLAAPQFESLQIQVKYGFLTQEQAEARKSYITDSIKRQLNQKGFYGGFGGMMGGGMMGGGTGGMMGDGTMGPGMMGGNGGSIGDMMGSVAGSDWGSFMGNMMGGFARGRVN